MKKIIKPTNVPESLNSNITNQRRDEVIEKGKFPNNRTIGEFSAKGVSTFSSRYKTKDIIDALQDIYNYKCAYCEQRIERFDIEHYRPKSIYYWLTYSWDNLLYCCPACNQKKSNNFPVDKEKATFSKQDSKDFHNLRNKYDRLEQPLLINPEKEDVSSQIKFGKNGEIIIDDNTNFRLETTVECMDLNRDYLLNSRKQIYDELRLSITEKLYEIKYGNNEAKVELNYLLKNFIKCTNKSDIEFTTFRKYVISNWLAEMTQ